MRKEKRVGKEFLFPWVRGICASSKRRAGSPAPRPPQITGEQCPPGPRVGGRARAAPLWHLFKITRQKAKNNTAGTQATEKDARIQMKELG